MRRLIAGAVGCGVALGLAASPALAHSDAKRELSATLATQEWALPDVEVHLEVTLASQLVLVNRGDTPLEVLDEAGVPFLRVGAEDVHANLAAAAWYRSYTAAGGPVPPDLPSEGRAHWVKVSDEGSWGWFDPRLRTEGLTMPHDLEDASGPVEFGRWTVPVRRAGELHTISGRFRYAPQPAGRFRARLTKTPASVTGIDVQILSGPVPGLYLRYGGAEPLVVRGAEGEAFLRFGPEGVEANVRSLTWRRSGRAAVSFEKPAIFAADAPAVWQRVSRSARYAWLEPRALAVDGTPASGRSWSVVLVQGEGLLAVEGITEWVPETGAAEAAVASAEGSDRAAEVTASAAP